MNRTQTMTVSHGPSMKPEGSHPARASIRKQRRFAAVTVVAPAVATLLAMALAWHYGVRTASLVSFVVMYSAAQIGVSVGFHRYLSHRSFKTSRTFGFFLTILGSINAQGSPLFWVATHRRHHAVSDEPGDPFSPNLSGPGLRGRLRGIWHAYIGWMFADDPTDVVRFSRDLMVDRSFLAINQLYVVWILAGLALPALAVGVWTRSFAGAAEGLLWGGLVRMFLVNQAVWSVGTYCHLYGTQAFPTADRSMNNLAVAIISFGEGLHNNHHAFPGSAVTGFRWWEPDISGWFVRAAQALGLVWEVRIPSQKAIELLKERGAK